MVGNVENNIVHSGLPSLAFDIEEIYINGKEGYVYSVSGKKYIDFVLGYGAVILGHGTEAFHEQFDIYLKRGNLLPGYTTWHSQLIDLLTHTANYDLFCCVLQNWIRSCNRNRTS